MSETTLSEIWATEDLKERIATAVGVAENIFICPQGALWNYGTTPTRLEEAEFLGRRNAALEILEVLSPKHASALVDATAKTIA